MAIRFLSLWGINQQGLNISKCFVYQQLSCGEGIGKYPRIVIWKGINFLIMDMANSILIRIVSQIRLLTFGFRSGGLSA